MAPLEHFWFDSKRGARIHNMIVRPPGFDPAKKYPLFVLMHGGPHTMWRDKFFLRWNYHLLAAPGYVVLLTNYTGSTGFGAAFSQGIQGDPLEGPALEINQAADEAIARYPFIDGTRQCAGGASYGGHLANWLQASTDRYRCLISHAGLINLESQWATSDITYSREQNMGGPPWQQGVDWSKQNPIRYAPKWKTPVLVTVGERDFRVPLNNTLEYWSVLQRQRDREPPADVPGREPLDPARREQPPILQRSAPVAGALVEERIRRRVINSATAPRPNNASEPGSGTTWPAPTTGSDRKPDLCAARP